MLIVLYIELVKINVSESEPNKKRNRNVGVTFRS